MNPLKINDETHVIATIVDITERKQQEIIFKSAIDASPNALIMVNSEAKIILANKKMEDTFGYTREEMIGQHIELFLPNELKEKHVGIRSAFIANPEPRAMGAGRDLFGLHKSGKKIPVEIGLNPLKINDETHVIATIIDISERKKLEETIQQSLIKLEESNKELENFAYIASHDLQEPLRKIQSFTQLLIDEENEKISDSGKTYMHHLIDASGRMRMLIDDLLNFSKLTSKPKSLEKVDLNELYKIVLTDLSKVIEEKKAKITVDQLPTIEADKSQMYRLFENLTTNSLKYQREGVVPEINVHVEISENGVKISFKDNGIGFNMEYVDKIFIIFKRLHTKADYSGTGIGLAMVKKIIDYHNGNISADSKEGIGTTFFVTLPLSQPVQPSEQQSK